MHFIPLKIHSTAANCYNIVPPATESQCQHVRFILLQIIVKERDQPSEGCTKVPPLSLAVSKRKHKTFPLPKCRQHHDYPFPTGGSDLICFLQTCHAANNIDGIFLNPPSNKAPVLLCLPLHSSQQSKMERKKP